MCFVHVLFLHKANRPNGRLAQVLQSPVSLCLVSLAGAIQRQPSTSSGKVSVLGAAGCRRYPVVRQCLLGPIVNLILFNLISNIPKPLLCQPSLPQPGHHPQLHPSCVTGRCGHFVIHFVLICFPELARPKPQVISRNS